jgi:hypothetical protein
MIFGSMLWADITATVTRMERSDMDGSTKKKLATETIDESNVLIEADWKRNLLIELAAASVKFLTK